MERTYLHSASSATGMDLPGAYELASDHTLHVRSDVLGVRAFHPVRKQYHHVSMGFDRPQRTIDVPVLVSVDSPRASGCVDQLVLRSGPISILYM
jgi:hypothetical protein